MVHTHSNELENSKLIMEMLTIQLGQHIGRFEIHTALHDALDAWGDNLESNWWKWLQEASQSLDLKVKPVTATLAEIGELLNTEASIIHRDSATGRYFLFIGKSRGRALVFESTQYSTGKQVNISSFFKSQKLGEQSSQLPILVYEPQQLMSYSHESEIHHASPVKRLLGLWKPDISDIWILVIFSLVAAVLNLATPLAVESLVDTVAFGNLLQPVLILSLILMAFLSFSAVLRYLKIYVLEILQRRMFARVSADLTSRLVKTRWEKLEHESGRELLNRFFDVTTLQKVTAKLLLDGIGILMSTLVGMTVLAFYNPWLLGFDLILLAMIAFVIIVLGRGAFETSIKESKLKYQMAAWLEDLAGCPTTFRQEGANELAVNYADQLIYKYLSARKKHFRILSRQIIAILVIQILASTVLLGIGGWLVINGEMLIGQLVAAELIVTVIVSSFAKLGKHLESFYDLIAAVDKLGHLFDLPLEKNSGLINLPVSSPAKISVHNLSTDTLNISAALDPTADVFTITEHTAFEPDLVTSHLCNLLYGMEDAASGHLLINETNPRDLRPDHLRKHVSLLRNIELFHGSLEVNIHLERKEVSHQELLDAIKLSLLNMDMMKLKDGLKTLLTPEGEPLNKYQQTRLMIARGIVNKPCLLIIDGLLDILPENEFREIVQNLTAPGLPWRLLLVTNRLTWLPENIKLHTLSGAG